MCKMQFKLIVIFSIFILNSSVLSLKNLNSSNLQQICDCDINSNRIDLSFKNITSIESSSFNSLSNNLETYRVPISSSKEQ